MISDDNFSALQATCAYYLSHARFFNGSTESTSVPLNKRNNVNTLECILRKQQHICLPTNLTRSNRVVYQNLQYCTPRRRRRASPWASDLFTI